MGECKILLTCSASDEKKYRKWFFDMIVGIGEDPESKFPCCLPLFRCKDSVKVKDELTGSMVLQDVVSYSRSCYSPSKHIRVGTMFGCSYSEILKEIAELKQKEERNK